MLLPVLKQGKKLRMYGPAQRCFSGKILSTKSEAAPPHFSLNSVTFASHSSTEMSGSCNFHLKSRRICFLNGCPFTHSAKFLSRRCQLHNPANSKHKLWWRTSSLTSLSDIVTFIVCWREGTTDFIESKIHLYASLLSWIHKQKATMYNLFSSSITAIG